MHGSGSGRGWITCLPRSEGIGAGVGARVGRGREKIEIIVWGYIARYIALRRPGGCG